MTGVRAGADLDTRISAARSRLILDRPFIGALVLRLPVETVEASWCKTTATDARKIYINPTYAGELSLSQIEFALAHEALHCALTHFARRQHREKHRWDIACDFAVNGLLIDDGLHAVPDALCLPEFKGLSAEEIYPLVDEHTDQQTHDQHLYGEESDSKRASEGGHLDLEKEAAQPNPLSATERNRLEEQWRERLAGAAQQALQAGRLSASLARMLEHLIAPRLPWRHILARFMSMRSRSDFDYARPGRREGEAILPALRSKEIDVSVAIDTSGSISAEEINEFVSEIDALKGQVSARVTLLACDSELSSDSPRTFEPWDAIWVPQSLSGGGGTDFRPVFDWAAIQDYSPDLLIYFTDGQGQFPSMAPDYPVIWLMKGQAMPPWGERIQLN